MNDVPLIAYPAPPPGYQPGYRFLYPMGKLSIASLFALAAATIVFSILLTQAQGASLSELLSLNIFEIGLLISMAVLTIFIHEILHGIAYQLLGYHVSYGFSAQLGAAYAAAFEQWQKRNHNLIVALTPLILITVVCVVLLGAPNKLIALCAFVILLVNTSGAVGDIYVTWHLLNLPENTLLYDLALDEMLIYKPV